MKYCMQSYTVPNYYFSNESKPVQSYFFPSILVFSHDVNVALLQSKPFSIKSVSMLQY